jgi:hypothetical protein
MTTVPMIGAEPVSLARDDVEQLESTLRGELLRPDSPH